MNDELAKNAFKKMDKGNKIDLQQILAGLSTLVLSKEEADKVVAVLREKIPSPLDACYTELREEEKKVALTDQQRAAEREMNLSLAQAQSTCREIESIKGLMELWLVYTIIAAFMGQITWLVLRKTSFLERITRWRNPRGLVKKSRKRRARKGTKLGKDTAAGMDEPIKNTAKKKTDKESKPDKGTTNVKDDLTKHTAKKMTGKETKVDKAAASEKDAAHKSKTKTDKGNKFDLQQILAGLSTLVLSKEEADKVVSVLREKIPSPLDACYMELREEEKKVARLEEALSDQQRAAEREMNLSLAQAQSTCTEIESIKMKMPLPLISCRSLFPR
ncbi:hypothetical protein SKAU_G00382130 [Synaphobranchus kaupii]|uniref:Uncharacterized protein n=1 Tax=Synaphobranchus kaupii TaxID=118154 RepID=A0A9Q1EDX1_SYNKA|nr:hypothetical protein SKAU_G00382130 [Synaphobranchus kaupii]